MSNASHQTVCLLSLGGHAYDFNSLQIIADWQRGSEQAISFIVLDVPESINQSFLGIDARSPEYFAETIKSISWAYPIELTSYSAIINGSKEGASTVDRVLEAIRSDRRTKDLVRSQTYSSLYFQLREVGVRNQRDPLVDACARYLELELGLLAHLRATGVQQEISFHERTEGAKELEEQFVALPDQVLLTRKTRSRSLSVNNLLIRIPNTHRNVGPVSFSVAGGQILGVLGANGTGKSTLLRGLAGHLKAAGGTIQVAGEDVTNSVPYRRGFSTVFQDSGLIETLSGEENVRLGSSAAHHRKRIPADVTTIENQLSIADALGTRAGQMSGGERQMTAFVRSIASAPTCILLDEPTAALDRSKRERLIAVLKSEIRRRAIPAVVVSHDIDFLLSVANNLLVLAQDGTVAEIGNTDQLANCAATLAAAEVLGQRNIFSVTASESAIVLDEWVSIDPARLQPPPEARGLRIPEAALRCEPWDAIGGARQTRGTLRLQGVIRSRRTTMSGDFLLLSVEESGDGRPVLPIRSRGLWLPSAATNRLSSMRVAVDIELSGIIWLK